MAQMLSLRDNETEEHARRVVELSDKLSTEMGLDETTRQHIHLGALLHDIGKVGIPDSILLKPGVLTDDERKIMMTHPTIGKRILQPLGLPPTVTLRWQWVSRQADMQKNPARRAHLYHCGCLGRADQRPSLPPSMVTRKDNYVHQRTGGKTFRPSYC